MARPSKYPWKEIIIDLEVGISRAEVHKKYKVPYSSITNYIKKHGLEINEQAKTAIEGFSTVNEAVSEVSENNPDHARAIIDIVTHRHPQFKKAMIALGGAIFKRGLEIAPNANATDLNALSKAMQTTTDTIGISQRHAPKVEVNNQNNQQTKVDIVGYGVKTIEN